jgi:hypothetical protein
MFMEQANFIITVPFPKVFIIVFYYRFFNTLFAYIYYNIYYYNKRRSCMYMQLQYNDVY